MRRRAFLGGLCGGLTFAALSARAQLARQRKLGVILNYNEGDPEGQVRLNALNQQLARQGWGNERDLQVSVRWTAGQPHLMRERVAEFIRQPVDVMVVNSTPLLTAVVGQTDAVPVVFTQVADPVSTGFVTNYSRPGGNITGFTDYDVSIAGKWVELLKAAAPRAERILVLLDPDQKNHASFLQVAETAAAAAKLQLSKAEVHDRDGIDRAITALSGRSDGGLLVLPGPLANTQRDLIIQLANRFRLPAIYPQKYYVRDGGLLYYGADQLVQWTKAGEYVDRILRGEKPGNLPVQGPTKFELVVNLTAAKAIGLTPSATFLAGADEVLD